MRSIQTEVLVIGGGATGAGVVRDLAMRGFKTLLVEKRDLTHGTTGRYHGLLHSGARYVVKDPQAARECIEENRILRHIMPHCIEDTGGFFVLTPWDNLSYVPGFLSGCHQAGIPVEELSIRQMLQEEPLINPEITRCFRVPDASADSFLATESNVESARQHNADILTYHQLTKLIYTGEPHNGGRVVGALCHDLVNDEDIQIQADMTVNACGAWAAQIAKTAGIQLKIIPGKGTMLAINHRITHTVLNRCKEPSDGDILVPIHLVTVIGTTDTPVADPDQFAIEPWEVHLLMEEGEKLIPSFKAMRVLRAWAGVRPLYQDSQIKDTRQISRAYVLIDHEATDGISGLVTITSGKWTTYRKMAEATVDLVCSRLDTQRPCRTALEVLPGSSTHRYHHQGDKLGGIENDPQGKAIGQLVCECELVTYPEVERAITSGDVRTIDDVRRDVRLGMGPCQGGFCTYRVAGMLHSIRQIDVENTNVALRDFLQERWKGLLPILWDQQLRQERLDELIYVSVLNADHLPGPKASVLGPDLYSQPEQHPTPQGGEAFPEGMKGSKKPEHTTLLQSTHPISVTRTTHPGIDAIVIGAGLSGLAAAWQAAAHGSRVRIITKGWGSLYFNAGCIDVLGYLPQNQLERLDSPFQGITQLIRDNPHHPYALAGLDAIAESLGAFQDLCTGTGYPMHGSLDRNWSLPTSLGTIRPTCLAPETMVAGDLRIPGQMMIVGFNQYPDFYPHLIADNLNFQGFPSRGILLELPGLQSRRYVNSKVLALLFEQPEFRREVVTSIKAHLDRPISGRPELRIGFPAVLGTKASLEVKQDLEAQLNLPVFEIPTLPPSIPGMRLSKMLIGAVEEAGGRVFEGMQVTSADAEDGYLANLWTEAAGRRKSHPARKYVLATGGILGGGLRGGLDGEIRETALGLPVSPPLRREDWFQREFLSSSGHPIFQAGITTDGEFQPVDASGNHIYDNLYIAGAALGGGDYIRERSLEGVSLVSGILIGKKIA